MAAERLVNWAGNLTFEAARLHRPATLAELQSLVAATPRIRALGTRHSFNRVADTAGDLVSVAGLPATIEIDADGRRARVAAGLRYGEVTGPLHAAGLALPNLGSLPHISIAGACATGTHGSGAGLGILATAVSALDMVTADGEVVTLSRAADPGVFPGGVVALGALGIVTSVTIDLVPAFHVAQFVYERLPLPRLATHLDEIFGSAYSVSLFTDWSSPQIDQAWLKRRQDGGDEWTADRHWLGAAPADGPRHPLAGMDPRNCTQQLGVPGPWHERLSHFRLEFTPSSGEELQSEYLVPREHAVDAITAMSGLGERLAPVLQVSELRVVAADDLWLSPAYERDSLAIHFTWRRDPEAVQPVVAAVEERLAPFGARPHWGKVFGCGPELLSSQYERLDDFARLARTYDPAGKFSNDMLNRLVLNRD